MAKTEVRAKRLNEFTASQKSDAYNHSETRLAENRAARAKGIAAAKLRGKVGAAEIGAKIDAQVKAGMVKFRRSIDLEEEL